MPEETPAASQAPAPSQPSTFPGPGGPSVRLSVRLAFFFGIATALALLAWMTGVFEPRLEPDQFWWVLAAVLIGVTGWLIPGAQAALSRQVSDRTRFALIWPMGSLALVAPLAGRGLIGPVLTWALVLVPTAVALVWIRRDRAAGRRSAAGMGLGLLGLAGGASAAAALLLLGTMSSFRHGYDQRLDRWTDSVATVAEARAAALQYLRLPADSSIQPAAAGEALVALAWAGEPAPAPPLRAPRRRYTSALLPEGADEAVGLAPAEWPRELIPRSTRGLSPTQQSFLRGLAGHPAAGEFTLLARAPGADFTGASYVLPFPADVDAYALPVVRYRGARDAARAQIAVAALEYSEGRADEAERRLREVVSAGLLLTQNAPTLATIVVGRSTAEDGARALEVLYQAQGRSDDLRRLRGALATDGGRPGEGIRGAWADRILHAQGTACGSLRRAMFGREAGVERLVADVRRRAVRYPSEAALLQLVEETPERLARRGIPEVAPVTRGVIALLGTGEAQRCPRLVPFLEAG